MNRTEETVNKIVQSFKDGKFPKALSQIFITDEAERHSSKWSFTNQFIMFLNGFSDARTFKQWKEIGRKVNKGEKAFHIFAPKIVKNKNEKDEEIISLTGFYGIPVFGTEQTQGTPINDNPANKEFIHSLPLIEVTKHWGINIGVYNGNKNLDAGYFSMAGAIQLGVKNLSTWTHELVHAADHKLGELKPGVTKKKEELVFAEVVAELGGATLLCLLDKEYEADLGGCYEYIEAYSKHGNYPLYNLISKVIDRTCKAVNLILDTSKELAVQKAA